MVVYFLDFKRGCAVNNRSLRILPFRQVSHFTLDIVREIKAIPDEDIVYSKEELKWMERAVENLDYMLTLGGSSDREMGIMRARRTQFIVALQGNREASD